MEAGKHYLVRTPTLLLKAGRGGIQDAVRNGPVNVDADKWVSDYSTDTTPLRSPTAYTSAPTPMSATSTYTRTTLPNHLRPSDELVAQVNILQREVDALKEKNRLAQQDHGETKTHLSTKTQELVRQSPSPIHHIPTRMSSSPSLWWTSRADTTGAVFGVWFGPPAARLSWASVHAQPAARSAAKEAV